MNLVSYWSVHTCFFRYYSVFFHFVTLALQYKIVLSCSVLNNIAEIRTINKRSREEIFSLSFFLFDVDRVLKSRLLRKNWFSYFLSYGVKGHLNQKIKKFKTYIRFLWLTLGSFISSRWALLLILYAAKWACRGLWGGHGGLTTLLLSMLNTK